MFSPGPITTTTTTAINRDHVTLRQLNAVSTVVVPVIVSIIVVTVVVIALLVIIICLCLKTRKQRYDSSKAHQLQSVNAVLNQKTREDEESYMDCQYDVIDKPPQNGTKSATVMETLYSNPNEAITDESYSHLQDTQKETAAPQKIAAICYEYSQLNYTVAQKSGPSAAQQEPTDVEMLYAIPDKNKKTLNIAPSVPEKSSELVEYLDSKEVGIVSSGINLLECNQTDSVIQSSSLRPSPAQQEPTDVETLYAIPDKKKKTSK